VCDPFPKPACGDGTLPALTGVGRGSTVGRWPLFARCRSPLRWLVVCLTNELAGASRQADRQLCATCSGHRRLDGPLRRPSLGAPSRRSPPPAACSTNEGLRQRHRRSVPGSHPRDQRADRRRRQREPSLVRVREHGRSQATRALHRRHRAAGRRSSHLSAPTLVDTAQPHFASSRATSPTCHHWVHCPLSTAAVLRMVARTRFRNSRARYTSRAGPDPASSSMSAQAVAECRTPRVRPASTTLRRGPTAGTRARSTSGPGSRRPASRSSGPLLAVEAIAPSALGGGHRTHADRQLCA